MPADLPPPPTAPPLPSATVAPVAPPLQPPPVLGPPVAPRPPLQPYQPPYSQQPYLPPPTDGVAPGTADESKSDPAPHWYDKISASALVDGYFALNFNFPKPQTPVGPLGGNQLHSYDRSVGASLNWVGGDLAYAPEPIGGRLSLRFGPGADVYSRDDINHNLGNIKEALVSVRPGGKRGVLAVDFGKFESDFGVERADSQLNFNYSRSVVYLAQPRFFTGFRLTWSPISDLALRVFAVNGWDHTVDNNAGKTFGGQIIITPARAFDLRLGYMIGAERNDSQVTQCNFGPTPGLCSNVSDSQPPITVVEVDGANSRFRHFFDAAMRIIPTDELRFEANASYITEEVSAAQLNRDHVNAFGLSLGARLGFDETVSAAVRFGAFIDHGYFWSQRAEDGTTVFDGTLTFAVEPSPNFTFKLDGRVDTADATIYQDGTTQLVKSQITAVLGVVVHASTEKAPDKPRK